MKTNLALISFKIIISLPVDYNLLSKIHLNIGNLPSTSSLEDRPIDVFFLSFPPFLVSSSINGLCLCSWCRLHAAGKKDCASCSFYFPNSLSLYLIYPCRFADTDEKTRSELRRWSRRSRRELSRRRARVDELLYNDSLYKIRHIILLQKKSTFLYFFFHRICASNRNVFAKCSVVKRPSRAPFEVSINKEIQSYESTMPTLLSVSDRFDSDVERRRRPVDMFPSAIGAISERRERWRVSLFRSPLDYR